MYNEGIAHWPLKIEHCKFPTFRWYAPAIGRFTGVDPIAEQFAWVNVFNYAENEPVANFDLHGLQAVFAADGRLLAYRVQSGQGPTQIAADLKSQGYNVKWTSIVDNNRSYFLHITTNRYDRTNPSYNSLNMNPGDILDLSFVNSQYERSGAAVFTGTGLDIYNEASRVIRQATYQNDNNPYSARDLIDVNRGGSVLGQTGTMLNNKFSRKSGDIYYGEFINEESGVEFSITLMDGGNRGVGTAFLGIYGNIRRERAPNSQELGHNPYAYTVTLPLRDGGVGHSH